jgi:2-iminobutanoate/2-iminopropanoate deaminase
VDRARLTITADRAPAAIGPYSHAVRHGDTLYCSGAIPLDPGSGEPARVAVGVAALPKGVRVEIDAVVAVDG